MSQSQADADGINRGALCGMNAGSVLSSLGIARQGRVYDLSVDLGSQISQLPPSRTAPFRFRREFFGDPCGHRIQFCTEIVEAHIHHGTHIDALVHVQSDGHVYGGQPAGDIQNEAGWTAYGAETILPIICRGVLIDVVEQAGHTLPDGYCIEPEDLAEAVEAQAIALVSGDAVLIRTGKIANFADNPRAAWAACPGISVSAVQWLAERGMMIFGIDSASADPLPMTRWDNLVHEELLFRRGIHIVENLFLEHLARDRAREFTFVCLPLKIQGATGAWARPIAIR